MTRYRRSKTNNTFFKDIPRDTISKKTYKKIGSEEE